MMLVAAKMLPVLIEVFINCHSVSTFTSGSKKQKNLPNEASACNEAERILSFFNLWKKFASAYFSAGVPI